MSEAYYLTKIKYIKHCQWLKELNYKLYEFAEELYLHKECHQCHSIAVCSWWRRLKRCAHARLRRRRRKVFLHFCDSSVHHHQIRWPSLSRRHSWISWNREPRVQQFSPDLLSLNSRDLPHQLETCFMPRRLLPIDREELISAATAWDIKSMRKRTTPKEMIKW